MSAVSGHKQAEIVKRKSIHKLLFKTNLSGVRSIDLLALQKELYALSEFKWKLDFQLSR